MTKDAEVDHWELNDVPKIFLYLYYCEEGGRKETNKTTEKKDNRQK